MFIEMDCPCKGKNLDKLLQPLILCILAKNGDMHGFAIHKEVSKVPRFKDKTPDAAGLYRYLKRMEGSGLLTSESDSGEKTEVGKPKRIFSITEKGKACLSNWHKALEDYEQYIYSLVEMIQEALQ